MVALADTQGCESTGYHLEPGGQRDDLTKYTMCRDDPLSDLAHEILLDVEPKIDAYTDFGGRHHQQPSGSHYRQKNEQKDAASESRTHDLCMFELPYAYRDVSPVYLQQ